MKSLQCHKCRSQLHFEPPLPRASTCESCGWDSRCCLNCVYYDRNAYRECREPQAEYVQNKDKGNFCGYFTGRSEQGASSPEQSSKDKLAALFGGSSPSSEKKSSGFASELEEFLKKKK